MRIPDSHQIKYKGETFMVYAIGWFALVTGRDINTIRRWEWAGIIPTPLFDLEFSNSRRNYGKFRWYLAAEIMGYSAIYKNANVRVKVPIESTNFKPKSFGFKRDLTKQLESNPKQIIKELPNMPELLRKQAERLSRINRKGAEKMIKRLPETLALKKQGQ